MMQITNQIAFVQQKYPSIIQEAPTVFSIIFPDDKAHNSFKISIPPNYPQSPPSVTQNGHDLALPILEHWLSLFQLIHVFDLLYHYIRIPSPPSIQFNESEITNSIKSVSPDQLQTNEGKLAVISQAPSMANAQKYSTRASNSLSKVEPQLEELKATVTSNSFKLVSLLQQEQSINPQSQQTTIPPQYIQQLNASLQLSKQKCNTILQQFHNKEIKYHDFIEMYHAEKKNQYYYQSLFEQIKLNY